MSDNKRFARQERLSQVGLDGQKLLQGATVAIIGVGALGCTSAEWLCRAGVAKLILIDLRALSFISITLFQTILLTSILSLFPQ